MRLEAGAAVVWGQEHCDGCCKPAKVRGALPSLLTLWCQPVSPVGACDLLGFLGDCLEAVTSHIGEVLVFISVGIKVGLTVSLLSAPGSPRLQELLPSRQPNSRLTLTPPLSVPPG